MPYNEDLTQQLRSALSSYDGITEKSMFGGKAFLVHGNMCVGVWKDELVVRLSEKEALDALEKEPYVRPMDITGKPMKGWLFVEQKGWVQSRFLHMWIEKAYAFAVAMPPKKKKM